MTEMTNYGVQQPSVRDRTRAVSVTETRARIVDAAEALFRSMGYQKTAVADIARDLGMSPANVYRFFPSKAAINEAIAARLLSGVLDDVRVLAADRAISPPDRLRRLLRLVFDSHLRLFFAERRLHDMVIAAMAEHWGVIEGFVSDIRAALAAVITEGMEGGDFAPGNPAEQASLVQKAMLCWMHPAMLQDHLSHGVDDEAAAAGVEAMAAFCLQALRASPVE